jgi:hypothetical protein
MHTAPMTKFMNSSMRERQADKNGSRKTVFNVLPNEKYKVREALCTVLLQPYEVTAAIFIE